MTPLAQSLQNKSTQETAVSVLTYCYENELLIFLVVETESVSVVHHGFQRNITVKLDFTWCVLIEDKKTPLKRLSDVRAVGLSSTVTFRWDSLYSILVLKGWVWLLNWEMSGFFLRSGLISLFFFTPLPSKELSQVIPSHDYLLQEISLHTLIDRSPTV